MNGTSLLFGMAVWLAPGGMKVTEQERPSSVIWIEGTNGEKTAGSLMRHVAGISVVRDQLSWLMNCGTVNGQRYLKRTLVGLVELPMATR